MKDLFLIACMGGQRVAIPAAQVESVIDVGAITPVPRSAPGVRGLAALRSRVVTVIDTYRRLDLPLPGTGSRRAVVAEIDRHAYAFMVDSLDDIATFELEEKMSGSAQGNWAGVTRGVVEREGAPVLVIDLAALLPEIAEAA